MHVELSRKPRSHAAYRVLLWSLVALALGLLYLRENPWRIETTQELSEGVEIAREAQADVIIVIDYDVVRQSPPRFEEHDWSAAWINVIEQELGPVAVATPRSLSHRVLAESRAVILTSSVSSQISEALLGKLREHVEAGNLLIMERPGGSLRELWAADGRAGERRGQRITFARGLPEPYHEQLKSSPLSTDYVGSTRALEDATTLLSIDGAPVVYARPAGAGTVVTVDFDLGEQLVAMQQGKPGPGFQLSASRRPEDPAPRPRELVMSDELIGSPIPHADLLERFLVYGVIMRHAPLPGLWPFPRAASGVIVSLHEDRELGDGGGWMLDQEIQHGASSTLLTTTDAGLTASGAATIHRKGGDIGLLWRMAHTEDEALETIGAAGFEPLARPVSLETQLEALRETLPVSYVRVARVAGGWWSESWDEPLRAMAAAGLRVDTSYEVPRTSGFMWGTGIPFLALRADGTPLGIREMPVVFPDRATEGPRLGELLEASHQGHHMAIPMSLSPASFADYPDMERFAQWLALFDELERHDHLMTSAYRFDNFLRQRRASSMRSRLVRDADLPRERKPTAPPSEDGASSGRSGKATLLRVTVEAKSRGMALAIPATIQGRSFDSARRRSARSGVKGSTARIDTRELSLIGLPLHLVPLERGFNTVDLYYAE